MKLDDQVNGDGPGFVIFQDGRPVFDPALLALSDEELVARLWTIFVASQMVAKGIPLDDFSPQLERLIERETMASDTDEVSAAGLEKIMKLIVQREVSRAATMFRKLMEEGAFRHAAFDEARTGRRRQGANARKPRPDQLQTIIDRMVAENPRITCCDALTMLETRAAGDDDEVAEVDHAKGEIVMAAVSGDTGRIYPISGLKDRLSRARKKFVTNSQSNSR